MSMEGSAFAVGRGWQSLIQIADRESKKKQPLQESSAAEYVPILDELSLTTFARKNAMCSEIWDLASPLVKNLFSIF